MRVLGILAILLGALAATGEVMNLALPTARWFFEVSRDVPLLHLANGFKWFGWLSIVFNNHRVRVRHWLRLRWHWLNNNNDWFTYRWRRCRRWR